MVAALLGAAIVGGISSASTNAKEAKQEEVSKGTESLEAINENQELAESVTDLTEEYQALRNAGESTADVLENMRDKIPELIDSYKELAKTMGTHIDTSGLEKAYEVFEKTGDITLF
jgi:predicted RNase H-like nuclease (RuvC/YqgF family)